MAISILIPIYNGYEYLAECLDSVKAQTFTDWECLVGMNGIKDDRIRHEIQSYTDNKIRVIDYIFQGKVNTLNKMVIDAQYDWIALLDVDDKWHEKKLEKQVPYMKDTWDVIGTGCQYFDGKHNCPNIPYGKLIKNDFKINPVINSSVVMKKELAFWDNSFPVCEDYALWVKLINDGKWFWNVGEILTYHRIHEDSYFNNQNQDEYINKIKLMLDNN